MAAVPWCCAQEQLYLYEGHVKNWLIVLNIVGICMYFCLLFNVAEHS